MKPAEILCVTQRALDEAFRDLGQPFTRLDSDVIDTGTHWAVRAVVSWNGREAQIGMILPHKAVVDADTLFAYVRTKFREALTRKMETPARSDLP